MKTLSLPFVPINSGNRLAGVVVPLLLVIVALSGAAVTLYPLLAIPVAGVAGFLTVSTLGDRIQRLFGLSLSILIVGYALQGRGFAYLGLPPVYIGELVLMLGLVTLVTGRVRWHITPLQLLLSLFMLLGLMRTLPFVSAEGLDALRDAALWYYAAFAIIVSLLLTEERIKSAVRISDKLLPVTIIWMVLMPATLGFLSPSLPTFTGSPLPILSVMKAGDRAVILAGCAAFILLGLYNRAQLPQRTSPVVLWTVWFMASVLVAAVTRGGMLAIFAALAIVFLVQRTKEWVRPITIGVVATALLLLINPTVDVGHYRSISTTQLAANITSIFSDESGNVGTVQGTKTWRLQWWTDIYEDTVTGPHFWSGRGFGVNIAEIYGPRVSEDSDLRSPHNIHMTILARMGVPGLALWAALQVGFLHQMFRSLSYARHRGSAFWAQIHVWIIAVWLAALVNATFDVYLEGPQGAIVFWCVFGTGLATIRIQGTEKRLTASSGGNHHADPSSS